MTPPILDEPIRGAVQERRKSRSMLSMAELGSALSERLRVAKNSLCAGDQTTAIRTSRYTLALAALTITRAPTSGG